MAKEKNEDFDNYEQDAITRPYEKAWENFAKFEEVGTKYQGYIKDVTYRAAEGEFKAQRLITLEQVDGTLVNVAIKRLPFILEKTDHLRIGDPLTIVFEKELPARTKGYKPTKQFSFYGKNKVEEGPTIAELEKKEMERVNAVVEEDKDGVDWDEEPKKEVV